MASSEVLRCIRPWNLSVPPSSEGASVGPLELPRRRWLLGASTDEVSPALPLSPACRSDTPAGLLGAPAMGVAPGVTPHRSPPRRDPAGIPPPDGSRAGPSSEELVRRPSTGRLPLGTSSEVSRVGAHREPSRAGSSEPSLEVPSRGSWTPPRRSISPSGLLGAPVRVLLQGVSRIVPSSEGSPRGSPTEGPRELLLGGAIDTPLHQVPPRQLLLGGATTESGPSKVFPRSPRIPLGQSLSGPPPGLFPMGGHPLQRLLGASILG